MASDPKTISQIPTPQDKKKILIVEDDFFIRDLYEIQARKAGYLVVSAADGEEAVLRARSESPHLILIDLMIPKMDGISLIRNLKSEPRFKDTPCVIITNLEDSSKEQEARAAGAVGYLLKIKNTPEMVVDSLKNFLH
ncbi:response regulator [Candidatus Daviesbacteria bacterium]|nr:response regulator [Candidatus Daviesbacteria bacterium]